MGMEFSFSSLRFWHNFDFERVASVAQVESHIRCKLRSESFINHSPKEPKVQRNVALHMVIAFDSISSEGNEK